MFCILGAVIGGVVAVGIGMARGMDVQSIMAELNPDSPEGERTFVRVFLGINHFFMFLLPGLATAWVFYKKFALDYLQLRSMPKGSMIGLGILFCSSHCQLSSIPIC